MWNILLLVTLTFALLLETAMTIAGFASPALLLGKFQISADPGTLFLGHVIAWFLLLVTILIGYALLKVRQREAIGWTLTRFLAGWWVLLGISIYLFFGRPDNLFLDSLKGLLLLASAHFTDPAKSRS